ncbi:hypothetical protein MKZ24_17980 [Paenibacillus sp. FSL R7-0297]|uniref:hypothetical protein n=1 Tax=unclassified Paenibacillus TaxID=185978 RepID=UPI0004F91666|nr:hypothetical protein [Paenibacillus sp. FSL R5-0912]AIQ42188.1 hypothetical protein R50912_20670 [Paenibacillus sp. FSL R5-0912]
MNLQLVPLRIPIGWTIKWNVFTEVSPEDFTDEEHEHRWEYNEDLFQFVNYNRKKILDLGWYPEFQPNGQYRLLLIHKSDDEEQQFADWANPLEVFNSRNIDEVKLKIEEILLKVTRGEMRQKGKIQEVTTSPFQDVLLFSNEARKEPLI